ncbi:MAG: ribonuclease HII [Solirubrobacterales bacterium]
MENQSFKEIKNKIDVLKLNYNAENSDAVIKFTEEYKLDERKNVKAAIAGLIKFIEKQNSERNRVIKLYEFDLSFADFKITAGADEVGRGPLAGPIVAASVILDPDSLKNKDIILGINDSKKLNPKLRRELAEIIKSKAVCYNIHEISNKIIDEKGIAWCNNQVLKNAAEMLKIKPDLVLSDGYPIKGINANNKFVIKGDSKSAAIAAASIIAKVYRDDLMKDYAEIYPGYGFENNAGYGTLEHLDGIKKYGITEIHRNSFLTNILRGQ